MIFEHPVCVPNQPKEKVHVQEFKHQFYIQHLTAHKKPSPSKRRLHS